MRTKFAFTVTALLFISYSFAQTANVLSADEIKDGWKLLFDGKSLAGWHTYDKNYTGTEWNVEDESIHLFDRANPAFVVNDLTTNDAYDNFDLKLDWKIAENGNSGVMFWVQEDAANYQPPYFTGPEMQVLDDNGSTSHTNIPEQKAGAMYGIAGGTEQTAKPAGEWNTIEIKCNNGIVNFYQNGHNTVTVGIGDFNWIYLVSKGYGTKRQKLAVYQNGKIDLQDAGGEVWYRNIKIKKLDYAGSLAEEKETGQPAAPLVNNDAVARFWQLVGTWQIISASPQLRQTDLFKNDLVELNKNLVCIAENEKNNTNDNVSFFKWGADMDTLRFYGSGGKQELAYALSNNQATFKMVIDGKPVQATLKKIAENPVKSYADYLPAKDVAGRWCLRAQFQKGKLLVGNGYYYDIHPSADDAGEIVMLGSNESLDKALFTKYYLEENTSGAIEEKPGLLNILGKLSGNYSRPDTNNHYYTFNFLNADAQSRSTSIEDCWYRDGVLIMDDGDQVYYLAKAGPVKYTNMKALYNEYNIAAGSQVLPPYGSHWQNCIYCGGSGKIVSGYHDEYDHTNSNGYAVYNKVEDYSTCSNCNGEGGQFVDDETGQPVR